MYKHQTTKTYESELFPGVMFTLRKMTEGRRLDLRKQLAEPNQRAREILREQFACDRAMREQREANPQLEVADQDNTKLMDLQDEFDGIMMEKINPIWIQWGVKHLEGLEGENGPLTVDDWKDWPSALFEEVLSAVKSEAELNGAERKNSVLPITSGGAAGGSQNPSSATSANTEDSGTDTKETAPSSSQLM